MAIYVLVHGGWFGGWCWDKVVPLLQAEGHRVYTPTLTGMGDHAALLTPEVGLDTHIQDVVNVIEANNLQQVILVGRADVGGCGPARLAVEVPARAPNGPVPRREPVPRHPVGSVRAK